MLRRLCRTWCHAVTIMYGDMRGPRRSRGRRVAEFRPWTPIPGFTWVERGEIPEGERQRHCEAG